MIFVKNLTILTIVGFFLSRNVAKVKYFNYLCVTK